MSINLIGPDIKLMRARYDEALQLQGIKCKYQFPHLADTNTQGEPVIDSYSEYIDTFVFFDGTPKVKTFKRYGWVVENDKELPFLIHCSFSLPNVQKDSIFEIGGQFAEVPSRKFRVTEISYDLQAPDHIVCQIVPAYDKQTVGRTAKEVSNTYNKSNRFLTQEVDYRGHVRDDSLKGD